MASEKARGQSVADRISHQLREHIISGKLPPGTSLIEMDLAAEYDTSRNSLREVLHQLGREGLVTFVRHKGVVVRTLNRQDVRDLYVARRTLELHALNTAELAQPALLEKMQSAIRAAERELEKENWQAVGTHSLRFHQHIVALQKSALLDEFFRTISAQLRLVFAADPDERRVQTPDWIQREYQIYDLLTQNRRSEAVTTLSRYLDDSERMLLEAIRRSQREAA
ncbi:GntR family transcriptional regulator [Burkholderia catarinensis]|uniref:GntR family transcriptional regulator n=1 Tax=Burkholderia catarinensis TaxID=1108140 RepID=UPI0009160B9D|nr:GntR family transcriptional regulator [Burkholderia catarinensis]KAG8153699.1 GntR family transcriptional regulator [Burkholderia catarinensis]